MWYNLSRSMSEAYHNVPFRVTSIILFTFNDLLFILVYHTFEASYICLISNKHVIFIRFKWFLGIDVFAAQ
jgi:hypothetical protein